MSKQQLYLSLLKRNLARLAAIEESTWILLHAKDPSYVSIPYLFPAMKDLARDILIHLQSLRTQKKNLSEPDEHDFYRAIDGASLELNNLITHLESQIRKLDSKTHHFEDMSKNDIILVMDMDKGSSHFSRSSDLIRFVGGSLINLYKVLEK